LDGAQLHQYSFQNPLTQGDEIAELNDWQKFSA